MRLIIRFIWGLMLIILGASTVVHSLIAPITFIKVLLIIAGIIVIATGYFKINKI